MRERKGLIFNVGTSSILVILLSFVLAVFALMSIRASNSEQVLAEKTGNSVKEYYAADQKAENALCYVDVMLKSLDVEYIEDAIVSLEYSKDEDLAGVEDVTVQLEKDAAFSDGAKKEIGMVSYECLVREGCYLNVELTIYSDRSYSISKWNTTQTAAGVYELDEGMELWDGTVEVE